jgi:hypothetical protein
MSTTLNAILAILPIFFGNNPTVQEIEALLPMVLTAIANAKTGTAFSVSFPESIGGVKGTSTFSWSP